LKILNTEKEDYHIHSLNFSDGMNTVDEIVQFAGKMGLKKIVIIDHSCAASKPLCHRSRIDRWKNVHNDVDVSFGVEADLLNERGDICATIESDERFETKVSERFIILSYHKDAYSGDKSKVADGFINAMKQYGKKINIIGHVCVDISESAAKKVILEANKHKIPLEIDGRYFLKAPELWDVLMKNADQIYINSDAHTLWEMQELRKKAIELLKKNGYLK
jgi:histidinol phosphatase-like PHP family hydrolase